MQIINDVRVAFYRDIMERIEEEDVPEAEAFQSMSILQTGLQDFSKMCAKFHPSEVR